MEVKFMKNYDQRNKYQLDFKNGYDILINEIRDNYYEAQFRRDHFIYRKVLVSFTSTKPIDEVVLEAGLKAFQYCADRPERYSPSWPDMQRNIIKAIDEIKFYKQFASKS